MTAEEQKAACHSDYVDDDQAQQLQKERLPVVELES